ncbi:MAG: response regulator transcription factor [Alphaproteobacteria bacterium]|nr:response regulator transcription factor [Alphaproteobacteria bacterium]
MNAHILVVDDDPRLREVVRYALSRAGFRIDEASDGAEALRRFAADRPDLIVLDVLMPEMDGIEVCRRIRQESDVPIVFLSSRDEEVDRVLGLELGGDDYVTKPFSPRELVSRVKAVLRRTRPAAPRESEDDPVLVTGTIRMDTGEHRIWAGDDEITLTVTEFRILQVLMTRPGRVYTRDELVDRAYPGTHHVSDRTLDSHVRRIRQKFRVHDLDPVETVHGLGYRLRQA